MKKSFLVQLILASGLWVGSIGAAWSSPPRSGIDLNAMDRSIDPKQDFYHFVNGNWLKTAKIPENEALSGAFGEVNDQVNHQITTIIQDLLKQPHAVGTDEQKFTDFYRSYMDTQQVERLGIQALNADLNRIDEIKNKKDLAKFFAYAEQVGLSLPIATHIHQDRKASKNILISIGQGVLGLADREFYMGQDQRHQDIRQQYLLYVANTLNFAGIYQPIEHAKTILALEKAIAKISWTPTEMRNDEVLIYLVGMQQIHSYMPAFDWLSYFSELGLKGTGKQFAISQVNYLRQLDDLWKVIPVETWQAYLKFNLINAYAPYLSETFKQPEFEFYGRHLNGVQQQSSREMQAIETTNNMMRFGLGKLYVEKHFNQANLPAMQEMVENVRQAFHARLDQTTWMGSDTKKQVRHKLDSIQVKIGYPNKWRDYTNLDIQADDLVGNIKRVRLLNYQRELAKVGQPIDPEQWKMPPQSVNAYYNVQMNEIVFPAAIWQSPFYDANVDPAVNYGGMGAVIAHEISHGFDDKGSQLMPKGRAKNGGMRMTVKSSMYVPKL